MKRNEACPDKQGSEKACKGPMESLLARQFPLLAATAGPSKPSESLELRISEPTKIWLNNLSTELGLSVTSLVDYSLVAGSPGIYGLLGCLYRDWCLEIVRQKLGMKMQGLKPRQLFDYAKKARLSSGDLKKLTKRRRNAEVSLHQLEALKKRLERGCILEFQEEATIDWKKESKELEKAEFKIWLHPLTGINPASLTTLEARLKGCFEVLMVELAVSAFYMIELSRLERTKILKRKLWSFDNNDPVELRELVEKHSPEFKLPGLTGFKKQIRKKMRPVGSFEWVGRLPLLSLKEG